jgi:hypothetical protein
MDKILEIHGTYLSAAWIYSVFKPHTEADSDLVCQPGARWMDINATLEKKGIHAV